jgi:hypothetical protein
MDFRLRPQPDGSQAGFHFPAAGAAASSAPFLNAHRRAFSSFSTDGSAAAAAASAHSIPANIFSTDDLAVLGFDDGHDQGDPKRRRIARVRSRTSSIFNPPPTCYGIAGIIAS